MSTNEPTNGPVRFTPPQTSTAGAPTAHFVAEPSAEELTQFTDTMWRMDPVQLAAVSGAALGLAERKARHTVIPVDHWLLKHIPQNTKPSGGGTDHE